MKNILFLEQFSKISGGQRVLLNILTGLDRSRYFPYVGIPANGELSDELEKMNIKYFILPIGYYSPGKKSVFDITSSIFRSIFLIPMTISIIRRYKINLVYANAPRSFFWATLAAKISGVPIIWHLHSIFSGWELKVCRNLLKLGVNKMIVVSKSVADPFIKSDPLLASKIEIVYNGIDYEKYTAVKDGRKIREELGIDPSSKAIGFVGQIAKWKGVEDFIKAAELVLKKNQKVTFLVVGEVLFGGEKECEYKDFLINLSRQLSIERQVKFLGKRSDIPQLLSLIDILVIPSIEPDPCPLVLLEAMASGKAVVASAQGGPAEIIKDGTDGLLYTAGNVDALANLILRLIGSRDLALQLGYNAKEKIRNNFSLEQFKRQINNLINGKNIIS